MRWLEGDPPATRDRTSVALALDMAAVVSALRDAAVPAQAHADPDLRWYRGDPLITRDASTRQSIEQCRAIDGLAVDLDACLALWEEAVALPTDLIVAWEILDGPARAAFRRAITTEPHGWIRARARALSLALGTFPYYWNTMPSRCRTKIMVVHAVLTEARRPTT